MLKEKKKKIKKKNKKEMSGMFDLAAFQGALRTASIGRSVVYRSSVGSTMDLAQREAREGCIHGTLVLAEVQTAGRGRVDGRVWEAPLAGGSLLVTLVLHVARDPLRLAAAVPLAVAEAVRSLCGLEAWVKWPNDVWIGARKVSGTLIDACSDARSGTYAVGIGVNVNDAAADAAPGRASLLACLPEPRPRALPREPLLASICSSLESLLELPRPDLMRLYVARSRLVGLEVAVLPRSSAAPASAPPPYRATATGFTDEGFLRVRPTDGPAAGKELVLCADEISLGEVAAALEASAAASDAAARSTAPPPHRWLSGSWVSTRAPAAAGAAGISPECNQSAELSLVLVAEPGGTLRCDARLGALAEASAPGCWTTRAGESVLMATLDLAWRIAPAARGVALTLPRPSRWTLTLREDDVLQTPRLDVQWTPLVPQASTAVVPSSEKLTRTLFKLR
jgi:BirA family biotin operon repressor/biotin-[acetyl-CoA-carboxylase] ligase